MVIDAATDTYLRIEGVDFMKIPKNNCSWKPNTYSPGALSSSA